MDRRKNVVLIGMPGAGKSTVGVVAAKRLGFRFLDSDLLIQDEYGKLLHELITEYGVEGFWKIENKVNASIDVKQTVIATGGSVCYEEEAMKHLSEIGVVVYLKLSYEALEERLGDLNARGVTLKGHPLCWHTVCADWLLSYDDKTIFEKQLERINREVSHFKGKITYWDVINETVILPVFDKYDNAVSRICARYGRMTLIKEVFAAAKAADPEAKLLINDFNTTDKYEKVIEECLQAGVPIDAIGIQSHQHQGYWGAKKIKEVIERFSRFGLPVHFTENTLLSGMLMPPEIEDLNDYQVKSWDTVPFMEIRQQEDLAEMYGILLNSPYVKAATYWDFADGAWLNAPSGLVRVDGTPKPAYDRLKSIVESRYAVN